MDVPLHVLIIEDSEDDAALLVRALKKGGYRPVFERVESAEGMKTALERKLWDVVLSDYAMPQFSVLAALELIKGKNLDIPFIIISGAIGEEVAVSLMKAGVHDYLNKNNLTRLVAAIERETRDARARREKKKADEQLRLYQFQLRTLTSELSLAEERQRRLLATDLHEGIGQILVLALIKLGQLRKSAPAGLSIAVKDIQDLINSAIRDTRALTSQLSPPILYDLGLEAALKWLCEQTHNESGVRFTYDSYGAEKPIDPDLQIILFQAARELIRNVVRHAGAATVRVQLESNGDDIEVTVEDDGVGFDFPAVSSGACAGSSFGLFAIRERLKYLGGRLEVDSQPGRGSRIKLVAPSVPTSRASGLRQLPFDFENGLKAES